MTHLNNTLEMEQMLEGILSDLYENTEDSDTEDSDTEDSDHTVESPGTLIKNSMSSTSIAGNFLLHDHIRCNEPTEESIKNLINAVPSSLSDADDEGYLPIHSAVWCPNSCHYVRLLAEEGLKQKVGGKGNRGGLLLHIEDPFLKNRGQNVLQSLANLKCGGENKNDDNDSKEEDVVLCDTMYLNALQDLRQSNLLVSEDVRDQGLLYWSCHPEAQLRFDYLVTLDKNALKHSKYQGESLIHAIISNPRRGICSFSMALKAGVKYHCPEFILDLLFQKGIDGRSACKRAFDKYGVEKTFSVIKECISSDTTIPILHHAMRGDAQECFQEFALRYPTTAFLRDEKGRSLAQFAIASGSKTYKTDAFFFARIRSDELEERDPITDLYPFMMAAAAETGDLSTIFYLFGRNPALVLPYSSCMP